MEGKSFRDIVNIRDKNKDGVFKPTATLAEYQRFIESRVYADLMREWKEWLIDIRDLLENNMLELSPRALDRLGGNAESVRHLMETPHKMITELETDIDIKSKDEEEVRNE